MTAVMKFFEMNATTFRSEWVRMSENDKRQLRDGIADGSMTY